MNWNIPNILTVSRIALTLLFVILASVAGDDMAIRWISYICAIVAGFTDFADGYLARKWNQVSEFGALMDPLADKIFATATMIILVELHYMAAWIAIVILSREFMVTGLRVLAMKHNRVISADKWGKWKTALQMVAVFIAGLYWVEIINLKGEFLGMDCWHLWLALLYLVAGLTIVSGVRYFYNNRDLILSEKQAI